MSSRVMYWGKKYFFVGFFVILLTIMQSPLRGTTICEDVFTPMFGPAQQKKRDSLSGYGSDLIQTEKIRSTIPELLQQYRCKSLIDAPCGDFYWMQHVPLGIEKYTGIDVIKELIDRNQRNFANEQRQFIHLDITKEIVPKADLILCRDCLVHLPYADINSAILLFKKSGCHYLLTTTFPEHHENQDIVMGGWRPLNLMDPPFCFPRPLCVINENCSQNQGIFRDKSLALWKLDDLPLLSQQFHR